MGSGTEAVYGQVPVVEPEQLRRWCAIGPLLVAARPNGCSAAYDESSVTAQVLRFAWDGCPEGVATELYVFDGGGHAWPGSQSDVALEPFFGPTNLEVDATEHIWDFFQQHSL